MYLYVTEEESHRLKDAIEKDNKETFSSLIATAKPKSVAREMKDLISTNFTTFKI